MHFSGRSLELSVFNSLLLSQFSLGLNLSLICPCGATEGSDEEGHKARKRAQALYHARYLLFCH